MMVSVAVGLTIYLICEIGIRRISYESVGIGRPITPISQYKPECWKDLVVVVSPGYWLARRYKEEIKKDPEHLPCHLGKYIKFNNRINFGFSSAVFIIFSMLWLIKLNAAFLHWLAYWRFVSRSVEIAYAFGNDVINGHNQQTSNLTKYDRIRLALNSYGEIFLYSAAVYLAAGYGNPLDALLASFGVGTLTNVSPLLKNSALALVAYTQVFTTISLVVLSLAVYVSREK